MAVKSNETNTLVDLGIETEYTEHETSFQIDTTGLDKISINELNIGDTVDGIPEFVHYDNSDRKNKDGTPRKWDNIVLHLVDIKETDEFGEQYGEYVEAYLPCPRPDKDGNIKNIFPNGFYHGLYSLIFSFLRTLDKNNVVDEDGHVINRINKINLFRLIEILNDKDKMEIEITAGADNSTEYLCFMINSME